MAIDRKLVRAVRRLGPVTANEVSKITRYSRNFVKKRLSRLVGRGIIRSVRRGSLTYYK